MAWSRASSLLDIPHLGNIVLCVTLVCAAYTFAMALGSARTRPHWLIAARFGSYATSAFVVFAVCILAYAFQTHDFRVRYIARYSDRSMDWWYLLASLWGGQDGSLLWWSFLLSGYIVACTYWMRNRYVELQPYVIAVLMSIVMFFHVLMLFAANPFSTFAGSVPIDGEGLNPLLQNYWMTIHPPSLYMGFVGWSVPFAIVVAALITGRLHNEWVRAVRRWTLVAWLFLSIGLLLGMLWSYEELGWGGYWAWDPVENASFMPWLVGTAFLHSIMVHERYGMLKVWNVFLLCLTFVMTIFGTFLTRSGLISSVHSFARSDIGIYFIGYLGFLMMGCIALIMWRLPALRSEYKIQSLVSREFAFLLNNWILLGMMVFVLLATTFPLLSEWLRGQEVTVGPSFYNKWMVPFGFVLLALLGIGPLISWRKATQRNLMRAFFLPVLAGICVGLLHVLLGDSIGLPAVVESDAMYDTMTGKVLASLYSVGPLLSSALSAAVIGTVVQEFWRGTRARMRNSKESFGKALFELIARARRRYGGYIVHVGIVCMYMGFTGAAYDIEKEAALSQGASITVGRHTLQYRRPRMEVDANKRMIFADLTVKTPNGTAVGNVSPAKFIYRTMPEQPTTEVSIRSRLSQDLYVILSTVDPQTKRATFRVVVRPLVAWIWIGGLILIFGTLVAVWPSARELLGDKEEHIGVRSGLKPILVTLLLAFCMSAFAFAQRASAQSGGSSSLHAGTVVMHDATERRLFNRLLCQCGECARLPLDTCGCSWAENKRAELRRRMAHGEGVDALVASYRAEFGSKAIAIPSDQGLDRALWAVPVIGMITTVGFIFWFGRKRKRLSQAVPVAKVVTQSVDTTERERLDAKLNDELKDVEEI